MVHHHHEMTAGNHRSCDLAEQATMILHHLQGADTDRSVEGSGPNPPEVRETRPDDRSGGGSDGQESRRDIGPDDRRPEVAHHLTFTAAEVDRDATRADDQLVDQSEQITGVAWIVTNGVDPPLRDVIPGLVHPSPHRRTSALAR